MNPIDDLASWLAAAHSQIKHEGGLTPTVSLVSDTGVLVASYPLDDEADFTHLAEELVRRASVDASTFGGKHAATIANVGRFPVPTHSMRDSQAMVQSRYGGAPAAYGGGPAGPFGGGGPMMGGGGGFGGPQETHPLTQFFGVVLGHQRELVSAVLSSHEFLAGALKDTQGHLRNLEKDRAEHIRITEELATKKHERDLELRREEKHDQRVDKAFEFFEPLAYSVLAKIGGAKALPPQFAPVVQHISSAFGGGKFDGAKLAALVTSGILSAEQATALVEMFKIVQTVQEEAAAKKEEAPANASASAEPPKTAA